MWKWMLCLLVLTSSCKTDSDCASIDICVSGSCEHKDFFPITFYDILGALLILFVSALANASGLGGGPLMTIIFLVVFEFKVTLAVPLSQLTVFSGAFVGTLLRLHLRHPTRDKPAIDYELLLLVISPLLLGTTIGVFLEMLITPWMVLGLLTIILIWITYEAARGAIISYIKENQERRELLRPLETDPDITVYVNSNEISTPLREIIDTERKIAPPIVVSILLLIYIYNVLGSLMRGSSYLPSIIDIPFCSKNYWTITIGILCSMVFVTVVLSIYLRYRTRKKIVVGYNFDDADLIWGLWPCTICAISAGFAGTCAGLLSIGGGIVMSPILLRLGLRPQVVVPTSSVLYVLTSSMAVILYIIAGKLVYSYVLVAASCSLIGSVLGIFGIKVLVNKFKRASIMVIAMTILLTLCTIIVPTYGIIHFSSELDEVNADYCPKD